MTFLVSNFVSFFVTSVGGRLPSPLSNRGGKSKKTAIIDKKCLQTFNFRKKLNDLNLSQTNNKAALERFFLFGGFQHQRGEHEH